MSRPVFTYFSQASYDALGFLFRGLQWPSLSPALQRGAETTKAASSDGGEEDGILTRLLRSREPQPLMLSQSRPITPEMAGMVNPLLFPESYMERWSSPAPQRKLSREINLLRDASVSPSPLIRRMSVIGRPEEIAAPLKCAETVDSKPNVAAYASTIVGVVGALSTMDPAEQAAPIDDELAPLEENHVPERQPELKERSLSDEEKASTSEIFVATDEDSPSVASKDASNNDVEEKLMEPTQDKDANIVEIVPETAETKNVEDSEQVKTLEKKDPMRCTHSTKHINLSKCSSAMKKKSFTLDGPETWLLCLQCGRPFSDPVSAEVHASRSNHPIMLRCSDGTLICFKCGNIDVTKSRCAQTEPTSSETERIRGLVRTKIGSATVTAAINHIVLAAEQEEKTSADSQSMSSSTVGAPVGLKNLGNTCFFNSSLQMLAQSQRVQHALKDTSGYPLASALGKCLREIAGVTPISNAAPIVERKTKKGSISNGRSGPIISPSNLFSAVCKVAPHFSGFEQQDAQELMTFLLSGIEDEAGPSKRPEQSEVAPAKPTPGVSWKLKHAEFWFGSKAKDVIKRYPVDEDDDVGHVDDASSEDCSADDEEIDADDADTQDGCENIAKRLEGMRIEDDHKDEKSLASPVNLTKDVFQIDLDSIVRCDDCDSETTRRETQYMLSLALGDASPVGNTPVSKSVKGGRASKASNISNSGSVGGASETLRSCLDRFFAPERLLVSENNGFQCDKCSRRKGQKSEQSRAHDATRRLSLAHVRDVLVLHFKRFHQVEAKKGGVRAVKIDTHVRLDPVLELPDGQGEMELVGIVEHLGSSLHGGHYVAYVRSGDGNSAWFRCSDDAVSKVSSSHVFESAQAYLALYERR